MTGAVLAACGGGTPAPTQPAATSGATGAASGNASGTLTVWGWEGIFASLKSQIEAFNQKYPNVTVDIKEFGYDDVHTNLLNAIVAGTGAPDLCGIDVLRLTQYVDGLTDLSEQATQYKDDFVRPTFALGSYQGKFYGLAGDSEPMGVYYRKDLWEQYGLKADDITTWADLAADSQAFYTASQEKVHLYALNANDTGLYEVLAVEQGFPGYYFSTDDKRVIVDDPKIIEAVQALKLLWDAKGTLQNVNGGYTGDEMTALLKNGTVATQIIGPAWYAQTLIGNMPELSGKWQVMRAPAVTKDGPRIGYQYPTIFVVPQQSAQKDVAWELARMSLIGEGAKAGFEQDKTLPAYKPLLDELKSRPEPFFDNQKVYELWDQIAADTPDVFFGSGFTEAQAILSTHLQAILTDQKTVDAG
ncbi:MAG TPA: extracellular solute-binding protein, partial [Nitrososphaera sp.]|nr:extracellular solute-binding protein [Nitrososphaera sp.]